VRHPLQIVPVMRDQTHSDVYPTPAAARHLLLRGLDRLCNSCCAFLTE
jgi:hypothetical protein